MAPPKSHPTTRAAAAPLSSTGAPDLDYDGVQLVWKTNGNQSYRATSGLPGYQTPQQSCEKNAGPLPEGTYELSLRIDPNVYAVDKGNNQCDLRPSAFIQKIPRGSLAGECEEFWANWGTNRVRLEPADRKTRTVCSPRRGGFYLHDSTKGYSHGCIEVDGRFFIDLYSYVLGPSGKGKKLLLRVKYSQPTTYGKTDQP